MKTRLIAALMALVMLFSMLPMQVMAAAEDIVTITVIDEYGNVIDDATVTAVRTYTRSNRTRTQNVTVTNNNDGTYTYDTSRYNTGVTQYYTVSVERQGYTAVVEQVGASTRSVAIELKETIEPDNWVTFDVYYIATGQLPDSFSGAGDPVNYGPSGDDVPLVSIKVNVSQLKRAIYADKVLYEENNGNIYHFLPAGNIEDDDAANLVLLEEFWEAVKKCMHEDSIKAFEATGLYNAFLPYCLKNQGSYQYPDNHCDGILKAKPPVYVIELYDRGTYFGGSVNDQNTVTFTKLSDILTSYNKHYDQEINWTASGEGVYQGVYIENNDRYTLKLTQTNFAQATVYPSEDHDVCYVKRNDDYYLATFDAEITHKEQIDYKITYTDGAEDVIFHDQVTSHKKDESVPTFGGDADLDNHIHVGWVLEGGDGTVYTQEELLTAFPTVTSDMTFIAVYEIAPDKFAGTVEVILNGTYDTATATASGEPVDIGTVKAGTTLAVSADGETFIKLEKTATGVYTADLENGTYTIYYNENGVYTAVSDQRLDINNAPRTRYLFFNTVTYDANGGQNGPSPATEYHYSNSAVSVSTVIPEKEGYVFLGWKDEDGKLYQSGDALTAAIGKPYTLVAQWKKDVHATVNVTVIVDRTADVPDEDTDKELKLHLTYRPENSAEDYVEVVGQAVFKNDWYANGTTNGLVTTTVYPALYTGLAVDYDYSVNAFMDSYEVIERTVSGPTEDADGNQIYDVVIRLDYRPDNFMLDYSIVEEIENDALVPTAVDVKVLAWYDPADFGVTDISGLNWNPITQLIHSTIDLRFTERDEQNRLTGHDSYLVWGWEDKDNGIPYYYRVGALGFTLADGTEITAVSTDFVNYTSLASADGKYPAGAYTAVVTAEGGAAPDGSTIPGAYFDDTDTQNGKLVVTVYAHPYNVILDPNGGVLNGTEENTVLADRFIVPDYTTYVPTRDDNYVFGGWYLADDNGNMTDKTVAVGEALTEDITLIAKWKEPLTVEGLVSVGATYKQQNADGTETTQKIRPDARATQVDVLLQRVHPNGYTATVANKIVTLDYSDTDYYFEGDKVVGIARYAFTDIPDDGTQYRVQVLLANYHTFFQNEPESVIDEKAYETYIDADYMVEWGETVPTVGTVNVHNHFDPAEFELLYEVDASAIGEGFRPENAEMIVTYDGQVGNLVPSTWPAISQMVFADGDRGNDTALNAEGFGNGSDLVWIGRFDGVTLFQYGLRVNSTTTDGVKTPYTADAPFDVAYQDPAHYHYGAQSQLLKATLTPKSFPITYVLGGGTLTGNYPTSHTWSYDTSLDGIVPTMAGFEFKGWYLDEKFENPAPEVIDASVAEKVTLYAKWLQVMDAVDLTVIVNHVQEGNDDGLANSNHKTLYAQLTSDLRTNANNTDRVFADVVGYRKSYPVAQWHTRGDMVEQDIFQVPRFYTNLSSEYDYGVNVSLEGYYVTNKTVEKVEQPDGSTLHKVTVTLQYHPDLLDLSFYVRVDDSVDKTLAPTSAEVKVTSWADYPDEEVEWRWFVITQHEATTVTVEIDPETGIGYGTYPVWHWYDEAKGIPYHYRVEVVQLNFADGTTVAMNETVEDVTYQGGGYTALIETEGGSVPSIPDATQTTDLEGVYSDATHKQQGTVGAVIDIDRVVFHANNPDCVEDDIFRTYYYGDKVPSVDTDGYTVNDNGTITSFYDIPTFDYITHNDYIFKGWYYADGTPISWNDTYEGDVHVYAHWIEVGTVEKEAADSKQTGSNSYKEYDLVGVQIRDAKHDDMPHYGNPDSGLRFVTVLSENVYAQINALSGKEAEYGFVVAKSDTADKYANGAAGYTLQYNDVNVNGVNTETEYKYVQNMVCSGVVDHYDGENYRLYTAVITYGGVSGSALEQAYAIEFSARAYLRYDDANGQLRTHYNNYTGTPHYHACSTSFAAVRSMMG